MRLYTLLGRDHTTLLHAGNAARADDVVGLEAAADGDFARNYDVSATSVFVIRPGGYLGIAARGVVDTGELVRHLKATFR